MQNPTYLILIIYVIKKNQTVTYPSRRNSDA